MVKESDLNYLKKYYKEDINTAITRLETGEAVQYIVGSVNFYGYELIVDNRVLIPRRETEELTEEVIKRSTYFNTLEIADVGTGSGAIAIALSKELNHHIYASDISTDALAVAKENILTNNANVELFCGNMLEPYIKRNIKLDIIVSNPPYIKEEEEIEDVVRKNEPKIALYAKNNGLEFYEKILRDADKVLNKQFLIAFEIGSTQASEITKLAHKYLNDVKIEVKKDLSGNDRMFFVYNY